MFYVLPCIILLLCFSVLLALQLPRLGKKRASLGAFRTFVRFALVWFCLFPLPLGVWEWMRFVIVALPGLFLFPLFLNQAPSENELSENLTIHQASSENEL